MSALSALPINPSRHPLEPLEALCDPGTLRLLRTAEVVTGEKEGRVVRYRVIDPVVLDLLKQVT